VLIAVYAAFAFAVVAALLWHVRGRRGLPLLAIAWCVYAGYEFLMYRRVLCSGECNIRVDLLLLYPLLLGALVWQVIAAVRYRMRN
jgi:hypothetical protein